MRGEDCFGADDKRLLHDEAQDLLARLPLPAPGHETISLGEGRGRILAAPVTAPRNVPQHDTSAVDGYAFRHQDFDPCGGFFRLETRIPAGHPAVQAQAPWAAARIFTGGVMPEGADTVAMQEDCRLETNGGQSVVVIPTGLPKGANRRLAGEDLAAGTQILVQGHRLRAQDLAAIASTGTAQVPVFNRIRAGVISTGDELVRPGTPLGAGGLYDANHFLLTSLLESCPADITDLGICPDRRDALQLALSEASGRCDVILTSGGASHGEEDHLLAVLERIGEAQVFDLAIKPGRRLITGRAGDCLIIGLPGNPVAAMVSFLLYARPLLLRRAGMAAAPVQGFQVQAAFDLPRRKTGRREFSRGRLVTHPDGSVHAELYPRSGSGLISSLREADGLIEIPEETAAIHRGDAVCFLPFSSFLA
ncbi:molybdopterin molybdotransferase MoeA [Pannonibacter sp. Q-1]